MLDLKPDDDETEELQKKMKVLLTILYTISSCFKLHMEGETKLQKISAVKLLVKNYGHDLKRAEDEKKASNKTSTDDDNDPWASIRGSSSSSDTNARVRAARERRSFGGATTPPPGL